MSTLVTYNTYCNDKACQQFELSMYLAPSTLLEFILWGDKHRVEDDLFQYYMIVSLMRELNQASSEIINNVKQGNQDAREALEIIERIESSITDLETKLQDLEVYL